MARRKSPRKQNRLDIPETQEKSPEEKMLDDVIRFAELYGRACGIIRADSLYSLFRQARPDSGLSKAAFIDILRDANIPDWCCPSTIYWEHEGTPYCIDGGLSDGGVYNGMWLNAKHAGYSTEEEYRQGFIDLDNNWSETSRKLNEYRIRLVKLQGKRPIKVIDEPFGYSLDHDFILGNPALTWLKENVLKMRKLPKREVGWRTHEAGHSIKKIAYWISDWGMPNEDELIEYAKHLLTFAGIIDYTEEEVDRVASMWARAALQIPLWRLNGHSVSEMEGADKEPTTEAA